MSICCIQRSDSGKLRFSESCFPCVGNRVTVCGIATVKGQVKAYDVGGCLLCTSLVGRDVEHLACLLTICVSLEKYLVVFASDFSWAVYLFLVEM